LKVKTKIFDEMNAIGHDKGNRDAEKKKRMGNVNTVALIGSMTLRR